MLAAAWTALVAMGQNGYMQVATKVLKAHTDICRGIEKIDGLKLITQPDMTCIAIVSDSKDVSLLAVADAMERRSGWKIERQQLPDSIHMSILPQHDGIVPTLLADLADSVKEVRADPSLASKGSTGVYGMVAAIPDKSIIDEFLVKFFSTMYTVEHPGIIESYYKNK
jgi:sphinganine-1-phosphate aldolase